MSDNTDRAAAARKRLMENRETVNVLNDLLEAGTLGISSELQLFKVANTPRNLGRIPERALCEVMMHLLINHRNGRPE